MTNTPTAAAQHSWEILRSPENFVWYVIPLLTLALYAYYREAEDGNWDRVLAGLAFWGTDWFNEIWNGLVFHFTNYAPVWGIAKDTAFLILMGLNIEITLMFAITGIMATFALPKDKHMKILGINNRVFFIVLNCILCVSVEVFLNLSGALVWSYWWWSHDFPLFIFLFGYLPFFAMCYWVYDMTSRKKQIAVVSSIFAVNITALVVFGAILKWI